MGAAPYGPLKIKGYDNIENLFSMGFYDLWVLDDWAIARAGDGVDEDWEYDKRTDEWHFMGIFDGEITEEVL